VEKLILKIVKCFVKPTIEQKETDRATGITHSPYMSNQLVSNNLQVISTLI
jgi:hypothetical protein